MLIQDVTDIDAGTYTVKVTYNGNNNYNPKSYETELKINKASANVIATVEDISYSEKSVINVKSTVGGLIVVNIDNKYIQNINIFPNTITPVTFEDNIPVGTHNVTIVLKSTDNYNEASYSTNFIVSKKPTSVDLNVGNITYGDETIIKVTASEDGTVILHVNDIMREKTVLSNTMTQFNLGVLSADTYDIRVDFNAGENYKNTNKQTELLISPATAEIIDVQSKDNIYGENTVINVKTNVDGIVTVKLNNAIIKIFDVSSNKLTSFDLGIIDVGLYSIDVTLDAGNNYTKPSINTKVNITPKDTTVNVDIKNSIYGENVVVNVTASENGLITVKVGEFVKNINVETNKLTSVNFGVIDVNLYDVNVSFNAGSNFKLSSVKDSLIVSKAKSKITSVELTTVYNGGKYLIATLTDDQGNVIVGSSVSINLNGPKSFIADANGQVKFLTNDLYPNSYVATITFNGNNNYEKSTDTVKVTVKKATPKITAKSKTFKKSVKTKMYTITLKNNLNKVMKNTKVSIKVNKKTYTAKTNKKGVATFKITKLTKKGTFKSVITYNGDKYYNKLTKTVKIKIK